MTGSSSSTEDVTHPAWGGVLAMTLCVMVLIASEFMPVSLLSPIARDLGLTEGRASAIWVLSGLLWASGLVGAVENVLASCHSRFVCRHPRRGRWHCCPRRQGVVPFMIPSTQEFSMKIQIAGSIPSVQGPADWFTGRVRIDPLFLVEAPSCMAG